VNKKAIEYVNTIQKVEELVKGSRPKKSEIITAGLEIYFAELIKDAIKKNKYEQIERAVDPILLKKFVVK